MLTQLFYQASMQSISNDTTRHKHIDFLIACFEQKLRHLCALTTTGRTTQNNRLVGIYKVNNFLFVLVCWEIFVPISSHTLTFMYKLPTLTCKLSDFLFIFLRLTKIINFPWPTR